MACVGNQYGGYEHTLFLGCSVVSFTANMGWNEQSTEVTVELVEDPCPGEKVYWDNNLIKQTLNNPDPGFLGKSIAIIGLPAYFRLGNFEFFGLIQSWEETQNTSGTRYIVKLVSPTKILEETKLIIGQYSGPIKPADDYIVPDTVAPYNVFNIYGYAERKDGVLSPRIYQTNLNELGQYSLGYYDTIPQGLWYIDGAVFGTAAGGFGGAFLNNNGMQWNRIKEFLNIMINAVPKIQTVGTLEEQELVKQFSPYGRILHKAVNYAGIGYGLLAKDIDQLISYGLVAATYPLHEYFVDLTELPTVPDYYRFNQTEISILEAVSRICQDAGFDFYIELVPVYTVGASPNSNIAKFIKIRTVSRKYEPRYGEVQDYINKADASGILVNSSVGREFRNDTTSKIIVGGQKQTVYQAFQHPDPDDNNPEIPDPLGGDAMIMQFWGTYRNGDMILNNRFPIDGLENSLEILSFGGADTIYISDGEISAATDISNWMTYISMNRTDTWYSFITLKDLIDNSQSDAYFIYYNNLQYRWDRIAKAQKFLQDDIDIINASPAPQSWKDDRIRDTIMLHRQLYANEWRWTLNSGFLDACARDFNLISSQAATVLSFYDTSMQNDLNKIYQYVANLATTYYGKKFAVRIPGTAFTVDPENNQIRYTEQPTQDGGWTEMPHVLYMPLTGSEIDVFRNESNKITTIVGFPPVEDLLPFNSNAVAYDLSEYDSEDYVYCSGWLFVKGNVDTEYVQHWTSGTNPVQLKRVARAIVDIPAPITVMEQKTSRIAGLLEIFNQTPTGVFGQLLIQNAANNTAGKALGVPTSEKPAIPDCVAFGVKSNVDTYGPWVQLGPPGGVQVEHNEGLVPWEYGNYATMNAAGMALAQANVTDMQVSEVGSVTVVGYPELPLFAEINSLASLDGSNLVETRNIQLTPSPVYDGVLNYAHLDYTINFSGYYGPSVTNITITNQNQVTTQYNFRTYTPRFGTFAFANAERLKEINQVRMQYIKDLRIYQNSTFGMSLQTNLVRKQKLQTRIGEMKNKQAKLDRILRIGTPHEYFVGQIINDQNMEKRAIIATLTTDELPTELGSGYYVKKSIASFDSLIRPISIKGAGDLPRLIKPLSENTGLGIISQADLNPYSNPIFLDPSGLISRRYISDDTGILGHDIDLVARSNYITGASFTGWDENLSGGLTMWRPPEVDPSYSGVGELSGAQFGIPDYKDDYRTFALRGPILLQSWGYDTNGYPVPNYVDTLSGTSSGVFESTGLSGYFMSGWLKRATSWPVAPVDLRLDRQRGVWVAGSTSVDTVLITGNVFPSSWDVSGFRLNRESFNCLRLSPSDSGSMVYSDTISVYNPFATTITVSANKARIATVMGDTLMNVDCNEIDFTGIG